MRHITSARFYPRSTALRTTLPKADMRLDRFGQLPTVLPRENTVPDGLDDQGGEQGSHARGMCRLHCPVDIGSSRQYLELLNSGKVAKTRPA